MLDTVKINHVQHISFTQSRLTDAVSVILSELLSYEHPSKCAGFLILHHAAAIYGTPGVTAQAAVLALLYSAMLFLFSAVMLVL